MKQKENVTSLLSQPKLGATATVTHLGGFSLRGYPAYSLLVLFLGTFYDLTKQKSCPKYVPSLDLLIRLPKGAQAKNVNSVEHLNLEVKYGF